MFFAQPKMLLDEIEKDWYTPTLFDNELWSFDLEYSCC